MVRWRRGNANVCPSGIWQNGTVAKWKRCGLQNRDCRGSIPLRASVFCLELRDPEVVCHPPFGGLATYFWNKTSTCRFPSYAKATEGQGFRFEPQETIYLL